jgi:hypothetical protein
LSSGRRELGGLRCGLARHGETKMKRIGSRLLDAENNLGIGKLFGGCACRSPSAFVIHG